MEKLIIMETGNKAEKVFRQYAGYIQSEESNILTLPESMYATSFDDMIAVTHYDKDFAADLLDVSHKTIVRYQKEKKKLSPLQSEYVLKTIVLFHKGNLVFGDTPSFKRWLDKPAFGLGNRIPRSLITAVGGINFIIDELNRIAHGDLN